MNIVDARVDGQLKRPPTVRLCVGIVSNGYFDFRQAWKQLGDMEAEQAMQEYISCVNVLDPEGSTKVH